MHARWLLVERVATERDVAPEWEISSGLAVADGAPGRVGRGEVARVLREAEDVDLEPRELVPERGLDEGREGGKLDDGHGDDGQDWLIDYTGPNRKLSTLMPWLP